MLSFAVMIPQILVDGFSLGSYTHTQDLDDEGLLGAKSVEGIIVVCCRPSVTGP